MATNPFINELHYDNTGSDTGEFVEIAGMAGFSLSGYSLVLYNGSNPSAAVVYNTRALSGTFADQGNGFGTLSFAYPTDGIQNGGNDAIALVGPGNTVLQFLSYEGVATASGGPASGMTSTDIGVAETSSTPIGASLALMGTGSQYGDFTWGIDSDDTPGSINRGQTFAAAGSASVSIDDVSIAEGDSGTSVLTFTVTRSDASSAFSIDYTTTDGTATVADGDYVAASGTLSFAAGGPLTQTISVTINGDATIEPTENFAVNLSNLVQTSGSTVIGDAQGTGTIVNDDVQITFIHDVQGSAFFSPIVAAEGISAFNQATVGEVTVRGVVTAIDTQGSVQGFYISEEASDWDMSSLTSEGIFVRTTSATAGLTVGETVTVTAHVTEYQDFNNLNRTFLVTPSAILQENDFQSLPTFVIDGTPGRRIPTAIISDDNPDFRDSDGSSGTFDPQNDALDFYETIEGMRVTLTNAVVADGFVSGSDNFVRFAAYSADNADPTLLNERGGYTISGDPQFYPVDTADPNDDVKYGGATATDGAQHGDILELDFGNVGRGGTASFANQLTMGDSLGDVTGILDTDFGTIKLYVTDALDSAKIAALGDTTPIQEVTTLAGDDRALRVATFNVENLSPVGTTFSTNNGVEVTTQDKFDKLAQNIAVNLQSPDIIIVEEVQDNNGVQRDSVTDASVTFGQLIAAVNAATGKTYQWVDEAPEVSGTVGGAPGGNIRVGFLYDTARVQLGDLAPDAGLEERRQYTDRIGDGVRTAGDLIAIDDSQVGGINPADWEGTRRSIVGEFHFNGQTVYAFGSHLPSKGGSDSLYQLNQNNAAGEPTNGGFASRAILAQDIWSVQNLVTTTVPGGKVVSGGDFNEFWFNRPLEVLTGYANPDGTANGAGATYTNLVVQNLTPAERFSYTFGGRSQTLDSIVVDQVLAGVASYDAVHINTGFNNRAGADNPSSSDHDPELASFNFRELDETLTGTAGDDTIFGFGGNDILIGGAGADTLVGGDGVDTASYRDSGTGLIANLASPHVNTGIAAGDTYTSIENLAGSLFDDRLYGDAGDNVLLGLGGNDTLVGGGGFDRLVGGAGDDRLYISSDPGIVDGGDGSDRLLIQAGGSVVIVPGAVSGIENVVVLDGADLDLTGLADRLAPIRAIGSGAIHATQGGDVIVSDGGTIDAQGGDDRLVLTGLAPLTGAVNGGDGFDSLRLKGDEGTNFAFSDATLSDVERIVVGPGLNADFSGISSGLVISTVSRDGMLTSVTGSAGDDRIIGAGGADRIEGGAGIDILSGGRGADMFAFTQLSDISSGIRFDRIVDFSHAEGDKIDLSGIDPDATMAGDQSFTFIGTNAFTGIGGSDFEVRMRVADNGNVRLEFDVNHDGVADASLFVAHPDVPLTQNDFLL